MTESRTRGGRLGIDGLESLLAQYAGMQAHALATQIETAVVQLARDDVALLVVRAPP